MTQYLITFNLDGATEDEVKAWTSLKGATNKYGWQFLELTDETSMKLEEERLEQQGWALTSIGNGILLRSSTYSKSE